MYWWWNGLSNLHGITCIISLLPIDSIIGFTPIERNCCSLKAGRLIGANFVNHSEVVNLLTSKINKERNTKTY